MKLSVIIPIFNRSDLFMYGLSTLATQSFTDWELVLVDDQSTEDLSKVYSMFPIPVQHIRIDPKSHPAYSGYHTPALAMNIGIRQAKGDTICITQPEILHSPDTLQRGYDHAQQDSQVYGKVMLTTGAFTGQIDELAQLPFGDVWDKGIELGGTPFGDNELYWYIMFVKKAHAEAIRGVDEEYLRGVYAEDDNFKERLRSHGILPELNAGIQGIHINHDHEKDLYKKQDRLASFWEKGAQVNRTRFFDWLKTDRAPLANDENWGSDEYIEWIKEQG